LLEKPVQREFITLAPGERVELWADFSAYPVGKEIGLKSLAFSAGGGGMMGGMMGGAGLPNGAPLDILRVRIDRPGQAAQPLPPRLSTPDFYSPEQAESGSRRIELAMQHMIHTLNGRTFVMDEVANDEVVRLGSLETWEFANLGGGMGMMMGDSGEPHPMHIHGVQFQVIKRQVERSYRAEYNTLSAGFVDDGWKDTVLVLPGEQVQVLVKFEDYPGLYLYHCHNLEHEDSGMMRNFRIDA
jgi:FtsP/CotA-like multicopper oxidase with cupredoxin domain